MTAGADYRRGAALIVLLFPVGARYAPAGGQDRFRPFHHPRARVVEESSEVELLGATRPLTVYAGEEDRRGADMLRRVLQRMTTQTVRIDDVPARKVVSVNRVVLGTPDWLKRPGGAGMDSHGFVIRTLPTPDGRVSLWISGPSPMGTLYGVSYFLQNYGGVRWVMNGELGEVVPRRDSFMIPASLDVVQLGPDFLMRHWSRPRPPDTMERECWLLDRAATRRFDYHHNSYKIFPPEKYGELLPELYSFYDGRHHVPKPGRVSGWQVCYSHPKAAEITLDYARGFFKRYPHKRSVSLSINDAAGHCYCRRCRALNVSAEHGRFVTYASYFRYINEVAKRVAQEFPGRYVAFLPYQYAIEPPQFPLEPNVIMFVFGEPSLVLKRWRGKVSRWGRYEWMYGQGFVVANHWPHAMQDCLKRLHAAGARCFYAETYGGWGFDGPKLWAVANLLWNMDTDVDAALRDYYQHAYGPEAAPAMEQFFRKWEEIYERRRTPDEYRFTRNRPGAWQFEHVTQSDYTALAAHLDRAVARVQGDENRQRLDLTRRAFDQGRYYFREFDTVRELDSVVPSSLAQAEQLLGAAARYHTLRRERKAHFQRTIKGSGRRVFYYDDWGRFDSRNAFKYFVRYEDAMDALCRRLTGLCRIAGGLSPGDYWMDVAKRHPALRAYAGTQITLLNAGDRPLADLLRRGNRSFEVQLKGSGKSNWAPYLVRNIDAVIERDAAVHTDGHWSLSIRGACDYLTGVRQLVNVRLAGRYRLSFDYRTRQATSQAAYWLNLLNHAWQIREKLPRALEWTPFSRTFALPATTKSGTHSGRIWLTFFAAYQGRTDQVWFDNVRLEVLYRP